MAKKRLRHAPIIGISCEAVSRRKDFSDYNLVCDHRYAAAIKDAGGHPVLLPIDAQTSALRRTLEGIDGLVIVGGEDIDPALYGASRAKRTRLIFAKRTAFESALYRAGRRRGLPIFGICYGMQLINVLEGGTLVQHLRTRPNKRKVVHRHGRDHIHSVRILPNTRLHDIAGVDRASVATEHHQAVRSLAPSFKAAAVADDGVIEAIEHDSDARLFAVQWHPERQRRSRVTARLFEAFVDACRRRQSRRKPI